jgi:anti-sigma B factor antagonist
MDSLQLTCQVEETPFANTIHPCGDVDLSTVPILRHALEMALSLERHVIVDLNSVTYIDSTGFRELLTHRRIYREKDRLMVLAHPNELVKRLLDLVNFYQVIPVFPSIESARDSLKEASRLDRSLSRTSSAK